VQTLASVSLGYTDPGAFTGDFGDKTGPASDKWHTAVGICVCYDRKKSFAVVRWMERNRNAGQLLYGLHGSLRRILSKRSLDVALRGGYAFAGQRATCIFFPANALLKHRFRLSRPRLK